MEAYNSHLKQIIKANNEDRLALFIGAGISKSSDANMSKLPLWEDLINSMKRELQIDEENDYLKIAQLYFLEFGEPSYYGKIKSFFPDNVPPSELHKIIFELNPHCVITTNWDCILESAIGSTGAVYSVICSDKDLVKSTNQRKMIKMHGDFNSHNIVFKEDDYLSYSHRFPLIENYIKSILSTHTVLFLGYGYNDINLKHITKWIQNHSHYCPPMYLVTHNRNAAQTSYLNNHGIKTLTTDFENNVERLPNRFKSLPDKSKPIALLLHDLKNERFKDENNLSDEEVLDLIYEKIKHLEGLNFILLDQITSALTNCGFEYESNAKPILDLFLVKGVLTTNYSESVRQVNERFISILEKKEKKEKEEIPSKIKEKIDQIMVLFAKANIAGIIIGKDESRGRRYVINPYVSSNINEHALLNFSFEKPKSTNSNDIEQQFKLASHFYNTCNYAQSYQVTLDLITACKRQKNYTQLLIALSNFNVLVFKLKYSLNSKGEHDDLQPIDLQQQFLQLPKYDLKNQQVLFDFISLKSVYMQSVHNSNNLLNITNSIETIRKGGMHFNNQAEKPTVEHFNLLLFTIKNHLFLNYSEFNDMMARFVEISIARQLLKPTVTLNYYEIYTCIKHFKEKNLQLLLRKHFYGKDKKFLELSQTDVSWLIEDVLENTINQHLQAYSYFEYKEKELRNIVCLLSFVNLNVGQAENVVQIFSKLLSSKNNTINTYESISQFFAYQHNIFEREIKNDLLLSLIENMINKVVYRTANGWDAHVITGGAFDNVYEYIEVCKGVYSNIKLVQKLIFEIRDLDVNNKLSYSKTLIYSIFRIGNDKVKGAIKEFISDIITEISDLKDDNYEFILWCVAVDFLDDVNDEMPERLEKYLAGYSEGRTFLGSFYSLKGLIDFLIDKKSIKKLVGCQQLLGGIINQHEGRPNLSSI